MDLCENVTNLISNNPLLFGTLSFLFGTIVASFFNVVIFRYPKQMDYEDANEIKSWLEDKEIPVPEELNSFEKINLSFPSSHCYSCHTALKWYHNIPVFSYLFLKGKCGHCSAPISLQYPIVETLGGLVMLFSYLHFMPMGLLYFIVGSIFLMSLFVAAAVDTKSLLLPDGITYFLLWAGLSLSIADIHLINISIKESIAGAIVGYLLPRIVSDIGQLIKGHPVMGNGDLKLLAMLGVFIGIQGAVFTFFAAPFFGIFTWCVFKIMKKSNTMIPYGPSLIFAGCCYLLFKNNIPTIINDVLLTIPHF